MRSVHLLLALWLGLSVSGWASEASRLYKEGRKAERAGQMARAYLLYSEAAALDPDNRMYWLRSQAVRSRAALEAKPAPPPPAALASAAPTPAAMPEIEIEAPTPADLAEARKPLPPKELHGDPGRQNFQLRGDSKVLWEQVAKAWGLDVVFDGDYQPTPPIRFNLQDAAFRESLRALEAATGSFIVPLSESLFLVAKDTPQKRDEVEPAVAVSIPLPEPTSAQDLTALITAVRQTMGLKKVAWDTQNNTVVLRDAISKVLPAERLFRDLLYPKAQVLIELRLLEVSQSDVTHLGLNLQTSFPLVALTTAWNNKPVIPDSISALGLFGGGSTLLGLGIANAQLIADLSNSSGKLLLETSVRTVDGQPATLHVGDKYPIMTAGYFGPASFQGENAYTPPPSFTFEDLGLAIKATARVHGMEQVSLDLESTFKVLTGAAVDGIPVISNRELKSVVRLKTGQWAVIAGLLQSQEARAISGIAGLSRVPVLGPLTRNTTKDRSSNAVLLLLRPMLLTPPPDQIVTHTLRLGSETRPLTPL